MTDKVVMAARIILEMTPPELVALNDYLQGEGWEPLGVREPREPKPESPGDAIALEEDGE